LKKNKENHVSINNNKRKSSKIQENRFRYTDHFEGEEDEERGMKETDNEEFQRYLEMPDSNLHTSTTLFREFIHYQVLG
jgi:hypothetical protein